VIDVRIYDITQDIFSCDVFPGDPSPKKETILSIENGDVCNLTIFSMCAHNGTHIDSPYHFINDGKTIDEISLNKVVGKCYVAEFSGILGAEDAKDILIKADHAFKRILIKGSATVSLDAAKIFCEAGIDLIGNESQTVGPEDSPAEVHKILLDQDIVLLEGIRLDNVPEGVYLLCAAPILLSGSDGAPVRAILIKQDGIED